MRLLILLVPFTILSIWVLAGILFLYKDIFVYQDFVEKNRTIEWYYLLAGMFFTGIPLWLTTVYYVLKKWKMNSNFSDLESFYLFTSYLSFMLMLIGHMTRPIVWGTMLAIHILFLTLLIKAR